MDDSFREILEISNIKLLYTNNKKLVLSCKVVQDKMTIYANKIFRNCPADIAESVVNLYILGRTEDYNNIKDYITKYNEDFKINEKIKKSIENELKVREIIVSSFYNPSSMTDINLIRADDDDLIEVEIVVDN